MQEYVLFDVLESFFEVGLEQHTLDKGVVSMDGPSVVLEEIKLRSQKFNGGVRSQRSWVSLLKFRQNFNIDGFQDSVSCGPVSCHSEFSMNFLTGNRKKKKSGN